MTLHVRNIDIRQTGTQNNGFVYYATRTIGPRCTQSIKYGFSREWRCLQWLQGACRGRRAPHTTHGKVKTPMEMHRWRRVYGDDDTPL